MHHIQGVKIFFFDSEGDVKTAHSGSDITFSFRGDRWTTPTTYTSFFIYIEVELNGISTAVINDAQNERSNWGIEVFGTNTAGESFVTEITTDIPIATKDLHDDGEKRNDIDISIRPIPLERCPGCSKYAKFQKYPNVWSLAMPTPMKVFKTNATDERPQIVGFFIKAYGIGQFNDFHEFFMSNYENVKVNGENEESAFDSNTSSFFVSCRHHNGYPYYLHFEIIRYPLVIPDIINLDDFLNKKLLIAVLPLTKLEFGDRK